MKFHPYTRLEDALQWLDEGRCRLIVGDLPVTAEMRDRLIFVNPVGVDKQVLVQLADTTGNAVRTQIDLAGKTVYVPKESPYIQRLRNLSHEIGDTIYIIENAEYSPEQLVILTALGEIPRARCQPRHRRVVPRPLPIPRPLGQHLIQPVPVLGPRSPRLPPARLLQPLARQATVKKAT